MGCECHRRRLIILSHNDTSPPTAIFKMGQEEEVFIAGKILFGIPASYIQFLILVPLLHFQLQLLLGRQQGWAKSLGPRHSCRLPRWSTWVLLGSGPALTMGNICRMNQKVEDLFIFPLFLSPSLCPCLPIFQINKNSCRQHSVAGGQGEGRTGSHSFQVPVICVTLLI